MKEEYMLANLLESINGPHVTVKIAGLESGVAGRHPSDRAKD